MKDNGAVAGSHQLYGIKANTKVQALTANCHAQQSYGHYTRSFLQANPGFTVQVISTYGIYVEIPELIGAGTFSLGEIVGVNIANQGNSNAPNSYGLRIKAQSGSISKNYSIYTEAGDITFNAGNGQCDFILKGANHNLIETDSSDDEIWIGNNAAAKIGFFAATPVVQPAAVADATGAGDVVAQLNALLARIRSLGLIAT
jgi:hypothetical protein